MWNALNRNFSMYLRPKCSDTSTLFPKGGSFLIISVFFLPSPLSTVTLSTLSVNGNIAFLLHILIDLEVLFLVT